MVRVRTIPKAVEEIKAKDPGSYISAPFLRRLVKRGVLHPVQTGGAYVLLNMDELEKFLAGGPNEDC